MNREIEIQPYENQEIKARAHPQHLHPVVTCKLNSRQLSSHTGPTPPTGKDVRISHYAMSTSYRKIKEYVTLGELEPVPRASGYYRPTPGNFGREEG